MMSDKNLMLVNVVKKFPCLYNFSIPEYMKKEETDNAWTEVARSMQQTVHECKEKWRNLRYSFLRSLKPNPDGTSKKKYYLHKEMEFLIPFMKTRFETSFVATPFDDDTDDEIPDIINGEEVVLEEQSSNLDFCALEFTNTEPSPKRRRLGHKGRENGNNECPRKMFLLGLLPEINNLTEVQMKMFRRKVLTLLDDISQDNIPMITSIMEPNGLSSSIVEKNSKQSKEDSRKEREFITTIKTEQLE